MGYEPTPPKSELDSMEENIIEKIEHDTDWVNFIAIATKKNGNVRLCLDLRPLNKAIKRQHHHIPKFDEIASKIKGAKYFTTPDAR